ncbi:MAG: IS66 family insertion sequence element accessory protein TnpB [Lachnospiraceae bacterium]|nr:IS66 family insertion sequence element accessory protein TnpB [Lachnospiraceae bacterium]
MREEKKCLNCGKSFIPTCHITRQKFCSAACRQRYNNAKRRYEVPVNICPECGAKVDQNECRPGRWKRFCSDECRKKYHRKKVQEQRLQRAKKKQICPNCGKEFEAEWGQGKQRRFCSDSCRIEWWEEYRKANPQEKREECAFCGGPLEGKGYGRMYCSRFCYLLAMDQTHVETVCEWCGESFTDTSGQGRRYCSRACATAARYQPLARRGRRRIPAAEPEEWRQKLTEAARASGAKKRGKRVFLVCGITSMYTGLDGLIAIIQYHLKHSPYDGGVYVFRDRSGTMLKHIEWDGQGFVQGKRRAQSGTYPWPKGKSGTVVEISEREFEYLMSRSIVPYKK